MSTPNFSRQKEWEILVNLRLSLLDYAGRVSTALSAPVSANAIVSLAVRLGEFHVASQRVSNYSETQLATLTAYGKIDTGDNDYDLAASVAALQGAALGIIYLCNATLPAASGKLAIQSIDAAGVQTFVQLSTADTASIKTAIDQLIIALGG